ncbi:hypothetical protein KSC_002780 [Ktedonobacter sp. SOSP1-52]|nr:hypothetical protein KSC_002780 [Ktedonobacter sp. SOSP1-52]
MQDPPLPLLIAPPGTVFPELAFQERLCNRTDAKPTFHKKRLDARKTLLTVEHNVLSSTLYIFAKEEGMKPPLK